MYMFVSMKLTCLSVLLFVCMLICISLSSCNMPGYYSNSGTSSLHVCPHGIYSVFTTSAGCVMQGYYTVSGGVRRA